MSSYLSAASATIIIAFVMALPATAADETAPAIAPTSAPIELEGTFGFINDDPDEIEDLRRAASGIACAQPDQCLVVFDEGAEGRMIRLKPDGRIEADNQKVVLVEGAGEIDAEGAATDGAQIYIIGSHAMMRNSCAENLDSRVLLRASVDADGRPGSFESVSLWEVMAATELRPHLGHCLGEDGVDIEAMALSDGRLWFGFRGPKQDDRVPILSVDAAGLFSGGDPAPDLNWVDVGPERGLRDMGIDGNGGLLLLAGPDDDPEHKSAGWALLAWDGDGPEARPLATLDLSNIERRKNLRGCDDDKDVEDRKPEALHIDAENERVLVLSDGLCDGGPMWFSLPRP